MMIGMHRSMCLRLTPGLLRTGFEGLNAPIMNGAVKSREQMGSSTQQ